MSPTMLGLPYTSRRLMTTPAVYRRRIIPRVLIMVIAFSVISNVLSSAHAALIASSRIQYCTNNGTEPVSCTRKMIVTLTVDAGQLAGTEEVVAVRSASDETQGGSTVRFSSVRLTMSRSRVRYRYPIAYVQNYNAQPYELNIQGTLLNQCNADFDPVKSTCGVTYSSNGYAIPLSQGFCCSCGPCASLGLCADNERAKNACNVLDTFTQASCLRFGERWYSGYMIGAASTYYALNITMTRTGLEPIGSVNGDTNPDASGGVEEITEHSITLFLSPEYTGDTNKDFGVAARLIGDLNPTEQPMLLSQSMLFVPSLPRGDPRVDAGVSEWMILDKALVTLDGRTCDKVGVSFAAFAAQGNMCRLTRGSCLNSQLEDLRASDMQLIAAGRLGKYMAQSLGSFFLETHSDTPAAYASTLAPSKGSDVYISYLARSPAATMITLTLAADDLQYIVAVASGVIMDVSVTPSVVSASTRDGKLSVRVQSTGAVAARFTVTARCDAGVFPMPAQVASIPAHQQKQFTFGLLIERTNFTGTINCTATLQDAQEEVQGTRSVGVSVEGVHWDNGTQGGTGSGGNGSGNNSATQRAPSRCDACGFLSVNCVFASICVGKIVGEVVLLLALLATAYSAVCYRKSLRRLLGCPLFRCRGGDMKVRKASHHAASHITGDRQSKDLTVSLTNALALSSVPSDLADTLLLIEQRQQQQRRLALLAEPMRASSMRASLVPALRALLPANEPLAIMPSAQQMWERQQKQHEQQEKQRKPQHQCIIEELDQDGIDNRAATMLCSGPVAVTVASDGAYSSLSWRSQSTLPLCLDSEDPPAPLPALRASYANSRMPPSSGDGVDGVDVGDGADVHMHGDPYSYAHGGLGASAPDDAFCGDADVYGYRGSGYPQGCRGRSFDGASAFRPSSSAFSRLSQGSSRSIHAPY